jgi:hypothetical protein
VTARAPLVAAFALASLVSGATFARAETKLRPTYVRPIGLEIGSDSHRHRSLLETLLSDSDGDTSATERDLEYALRKSAWLRVVPDEGEVAVAVRNRHREETSRSRSKDGRRVTINYRYRIRGAIGMEGEKDSLEAEVTSSRTYDSDSSRLYPSSHEDEDGFERAARELASKVRGWVLDRVKGLRPEGPYSGFQHRVKLKWLVKGDGLEVTEVAPDSPSAAAGIEVGDRIRRIDGEDGTSEMDERVRALRLEAPGTRVVLELERQKRRRFVELELVAPRGRARAR